MKVSSYDEFLWFQSLARLKDSFVNDRGSQSDLWASSVSLESSSPSLPRQYLDVSSQTDVTGNVSKVWETNCIWKHSSETRTALPSYKVSGVGKYL